METKLLPQGLELWSVTSVALKPLLKTSSKDMKYIAGLDGFVAGVSIAEKRATLFYFATEADGIRARNMMEAKGIPVGDNVCRWVVDKDGVLEFANERAKEDTDAN